METKLSNLLYLMKSEDWFAAIRFAAKFPRLGIQKDDILRAKDALNNPEFYRQINRDPDALVKCGIDALKSKYLRS